MISPEDFPRVFNTMPPLKKGYPYDIGPEEIKEEIKKLLPIALSTQTMHQFITAANALIQLGNTELNNRFSKKSFYMMLGLTVLSVLGGFLSIWYAIRTDKNDTAWRMQETQILQQIESNTAR